MPDIGNSYNISRDYIDSLLIETRYMDSVTPDISFSLYGRTFTSPVMTAALSHLDHFMFPGAADALADGARDAGSILWYGMAEDEEITRLAGICPDMIEIIKPYKDRKEIYHRIELAEKLGLIAVGVDIDHAFSSDGTNDIVSGYEMEPLRTEELREICASAHLPVIVKGILSIYDTEKCVSAGARGLVLSHHNNRIGYAVPPMVVLPEIAAYVKGEIPIFADCEIRTGMDAFKAMALGAAGVCIGRPLMTAIKNGGKAGCAEYLTGANNELKRTMAFTGCPDLGSIEPSIIRRI